MISKSYGKKTVLNNVNIDFDDQCSLIIGENGSGKTTILKILSGLIQKFDGEFKKIQTVSLMLDSEMLSLYKTGKENLDYFLTKDEVKISEKWLSFFKMEDYIGDKVKTYSNGMKKRLMLVIAVSKVRDAVILDEPTNSLDMEGIDLLKKCIAEIKKEKKIIIATHDIALADTDVIDNLYLLNKTGLIRKNINDFKYRLYMVKTLKEIGENYPKIIDDERVIFKVNTDEKEEFFKYIAEFIPVEIEELPIFDKLYFRGLYDEKNI